jgi:hypothetical protein
MNIPTIHHDRALHFLWGDLASLVGHAAEIFSRHFGLDLPRGLLGMAACAAVALGREAFNVSEAGRWSWADFGWTLGGGASTSGPYALGGAP